MKSETTAEEHEPERENRHTPRPGLVLIYANEKPIFSLHPLEGGFIEIGRELLLPNDDRASRRHARVSFDGSLWRVADLESRNGTHLDGKRVEGEVSSDSTRLVRVGRSLFLLSPDLERFEAGMKLTDGLVIGPNLKRAHDLIERTAKLQDTLFVRGESGSGKELAARIFHRARCSADGPFVAVNCAAIPNGLAERLLFGAMKGAYSGAVSDVEGYLQAADGGTLFLDEIAELDQSVQAKLLRVVETKEVIALGDTTARKVRFSLCSATHRDLREAVSSGRFRDDLYFRIGRPEVRVPPIRERLEEIPWYVVRELSALDENIIAHVSFVESCLLRAWPGNVRELVAEVRRAAQEAVAASRRSVEADDLAPDAGLAFPSGLERKASPPRSERSAAAPRKRAPRGRMPVRAAIEEALRLEHGNVTLAAQRLGLHRTQLRRWLESHAIDPHTFVPE